MGKSSEMGTVAGSPYTVAEELNTSMLCHDFKKDQGAGNIVFIILQRHGNRLAHSFQAGKMNNCVDRILLKNPVKQRLVQKINLMKKQLSGAYLFNTPDGFFPAVYQAIDHYYFVSGLQQFHAGMAADISCSSCYKYLHVLILSMKL
jgi:hypothetical protein